MTTSSNDELCCSRRYTLKSKKGMTVRTQRFCSFSRIALFSNIILWLISFNPFPFMAILSKTQKNHRLKHDFFSFRNQCVLKWIFVYIKSLSNTVLRIRIKNWNFYRHDFYDFFNTIRKTNHLVLNLKKILMILLLHCRQCLRKDFLKLIYKKVKQWSQIYIKFNIFLDITIKKTVLKYNRYLRSCARKARTK